MGIKAVFDDLSNRVTATYGALGLKIPTIKLGANSLSDQDSFPRIVVVPATETIGYDIGQAGFGDGVTLPQALWTRKCRLEMHLWAQDFDACEEMINHVCAALHDSVWGSDRAVSADWTKGQAFNSKSGLLCILAVTVDFPIPRETEATARITTFTPIDAEIVVPVVS